MARVGRAERPRPQAHVRARLGAVLEFVDDAADAHLGICALAVIWVPQLSLPRNLEADEAFHEAVGIAQ